MVGVGGPLLVLLGVSLGHTLRGRWMTAALLQHWQMDLFGGVVVLLTVLASRRDGLLLLDSLVALCCALYVASASGVALRQAIRGLMDASVDESALEMIHAAVDAVDGVLGVPSLVAIRCGRATHVTAKVAVSRATTMDAAGRIRDRIATAVGRQTDDVTEVLVEFEPADKAPRRRKTKSGRSQVPRPSEEGP